MIYISDPDLKGRPCSARTLSKICKVNDTQKCHVVSYQNTNNDCNFSNLRSLQGISLTWSPYQGSNL